MNDPNANETQERLVADMMRVATVYSRFSGRRLSTISREAVGMSRYFDKIQGANGSTVKIYGQMIQWFSDNWPDDQPVPWPVGVPRPVPTRLQKAVPPAPIRRQGDDAGESDDGVDMD